MNSLTFMHNISEEVSRLSKILLEIDSLKVINPLLDYIRNSSHIVFLNPVKCKHYLNSYLYRTLFSHLIKKN